MELQGKTVAILIEDMYNEFEFWYPFYRLKEAGAKVLVVGSGRTKNFTSKIGLPVSADVDAQSVSAADLDGVIIPGGYAPDHMRRHPAMVSLVKDLFAAGKMVAAICHAGWMLASAGVLEGKTVTSYVAIRDDVVNAGAEWVDKEVVVDGNLVTSRKPDDLPVFLRAILQVLGNV